MLSDDHKVEESRADAEITEDNGGPVVFVAVVVLL